MAMCHGFVQYLDKVPLPPKCGIMNIRFNVDNMSSESRQCIIQRCCWTAELGHQDDYMIFENNNGTFNVGMFYFYIQLIEKLRTAHPRNDCVLKSKRVKTRAVYDGTIRPSAVSKNVIHTYPQTSQTIKIQISCPNWCVCQKWNWLKKTTELCKLCLHNGCKIFTLQSMPKAQSFQIILLLFIQRQIDVLHMLHSLTFDIWTNKKLNYSTAIGLLLTYEEYQKKLSSR